MPYFISKFGPKIPSKPIRSHLLQFFFKKQVLVNSSSHFANISTTMLSHIIIILPHAALEAKEIHPTWWHPHLKLQTMILEMITSSISCKQALSTFHWQSRFLILRFLSTLFSPLTLQDGNLGLISYSRMSSTWFSRKKSSPLYHSQWTGKFI